MQYLITIYTIGAAQGIILAIALLRKPINKSSNKILVFLLLSLAFDLTVRIIFLNNNQTPFMPAFVIARFFPFFYGSAFYLYVRSLINSQPFKLKDLIHFTGFIIIVAINLKAIFSPIGSPPQELIYSDLLLFSYSISYVVAGLILIINYRKSLLQQKVDIEDIDLKWLNIMAIWQIIIWFVAVSQWLIPFEEFNHWSIFIVVSIWISVMGYLGLSQHQLEPIVKLNTQVIAPDDKRFENVKRALDDLITNKQIHLKPSLTIVELAKQSGYPEYLVSQFINRVYGYNFREYINDLRIKNAQIILSNLTDKRTILDIAYDCGYNSKSTFNHAFKRITGVTPSTFRREKLST